MEAKKVTIYTDGACLGNPGPGGYAAVLLYGDRRRELTGGFQKTTNNRMEIMGAIAGLNALKIRCRVTLYSDSQYLVNAIMLGWAQRWKGNGWKRDRKHMASNVDLWEQLLELCKKHEVEFKWVRGHAGNTENERCDKLSQQAAQQNNLPLDQGYERDR
ncbi:MAG: ribonuclease HI [Acidobacteria bacterium]|nr:ribonuclease HI [Acidobacteriota bacterium]MBI3658637.1 ribonuclease HI [Acidobacteriota bacterium]